jgi:hypothetical protein
MYCLLFVVSNRVREAVSLLIEFNLGLDRRGVVTHTCYFMKKENRLLSIIWWKMKQKTLAFQAV